MTTPITVTGTVTDSIGATTTDTATVTVTTGSGSRTLRRSLLGERLPIGSMINLGIKGPSAGTEANAREFGVEFIVMWNCTLEKVRIYKHPDAAGSVPVTLWNATTQAVIATTTVTWVADTGGWVDVPLTASLTTTGKYIVSYFAVNIKYYEVVWKFHVMDYVEPPFIVKNLDEGTSPASNGSVQNSTGHGFPDRHSASNWFIDPVVSWTTTYPGYSGGTSYYDQWVNGQLSYGVPIGVFFPDPPFMDDYMSVGINTAIGIPIDENPGYRAAIASSEMDVYAAVADSTVATRLTLTDDVYGERVKGYFLSDEPDMTGTYETPAELRARLAEVKSIDATRPVILNLGMWTAVAQGYGWAPPGATPEQVNANWIEYARMADVLSCDYYNIVNTNGIYGIWTYPVQVRRMRLLCEDRAPVFGYVETCSQAGSSLTPTAEQIRRAVWACIIAGATGIVFFDHQFSPVQDFAFMLHDTAKRAMVTALTAQIQSLSIPILSRDVPLVEAVTSTNTTEGPYGGVFGVPIEYSTRQNGTTQYLFAMAARPGSTTASFTIPSAASTTVTVLGESRTISVGSGGVLTDTFNSGDYTVHLYRWTGVPVDTTPPTVPTGLAASSLSAGGFTLTWTSSTDSTGVTGYRVRINGTIYATPTGTTQVVTGLSASTSYSVTVEATDARNNWSAQSAVLPVTTLGDTTPPSVPTGLSSSSVFSTGATINWTASTDDVAVTGYEVFVNGTSYGTPSTTTQILTGLPASSSSSITVRARDAAGNWSAQSLPLTVSTGVIPLMVSSFDFHENTGSTATSSTGGYQLVASTPGTAWNSGKAASRFQGVIGPNAATANWTIAFDATLGAANSTWEWMLLPVSPSGQAWIQMGGSQQVEVFQGSAMRSTTALTVGVTTKIVVTSSASSLKLYFDGVLEASRGTGFSINPGPTTFGALSIVNNGSMVATLDNLQYWGQKLTSAQVWALTHDPSTLPGTLLGEWRFLDNLDDTSGNGHTATFSAGSSGGTYSYVTGPAAETRAIKFGGLEHSLNYGYTGLEATADGFCIMGWVKVDTGSGQTQFGVLHKERVSNSWRSLLSVKDNGSSFSLAPLFRWKDDLNSTPPSLGSFTGSGWHHVAIVDDNSRQAWFLDGTRLGQVTRSFTNATSPTWDVPHFPWKSGFTAEAKATSALAITGVRIIQGVLSDSDVVTWMNEPIM